jgi:hypothetical protein
MDRTQIGRAGELALALYAMVTSDGALELFTPVSDEDHVDVTIGLRGSIPAIAVQVKTSPAVDRNGMVEARAEFAPDHVREHPAFLYAVLLMSSVSVTSSWIVPSPDFNRLAYRSDRDGRIGLEFRAHPAGTDSWSPFRVVPLELGPHLVAVIGSLPETIPPEFIR